MTSTRTYFGLSLLKKDPCNIPAGNAGKKNKKLVVNSQSFVFKNMRYIPLKSNYTDDK